MLITTLSLIQFNFQNQEFLQDQNHSLNLVLLHLPIILMQQIRFHHQVNSLRRIFSLHLTIFRNLKSLLVHFTSPTRSSSQKQKNSQVHISLLHLTTIMQLIHLLLLHLSQVLKNLLNRVFFQCH